MKKPMNVIPDTFLNYASIVLGDTESGLSGPEIVKVFNAYAIDLNVDDIPHSNYPFDAPNKRTALLENLSKFCPQHQFKIIKELCDYPKLAEKNNEVDKLRIQLIAKFGAFFGNRFDSTLNQTLIEEAKSFLSKYPESEKPYLEAIEKFNNDIFVRNTLDDLRLSLELLCNEIFNNKKTLDNNIDQIGELIKSKGGSKEFTNMFAKLVDYYNKYQNSYVKHNDGVIEDEVEFIFEMTSSFMKHLIKMNKK